MIEAAIYEIKGLRTRNQSQKNIPKLTCHKTKATFEKTTRVQLTLLFRENVMFVEIALA